MERGRLSVRPSAGREDGGWEGNDEAGTLANTIPSGERERGRTMHAREKLRRFASGEERQKERGRKKKQEREREVVLFVQ